jgi:hypothetical protein
VIVFLAVEPHMRWSREFIGVASAGPMVMEAVRRVHMAVTQQR